VVGVNYTAGMKPVSPGAFAQPAPAPVLRPAPSAPLQTFQLPTATVRLSGVTLINTKAPAPTPPTQLTKAAISQITKSQVAAIPARAAAPNPAPTLRAAGLTSTSFKTPLQSIGSQSSAPPPALVSTSATPTAPPRAPAALRPYSKPLGTVDVAPALSAPPAKADDPAAMIPTRDAGFGSTSSALTSDWRGSAPVATGYAPLGFGGGPSDGVSLQGFPVVLVGLGLLAAVLIFGGGG